MLVPRITICVLSLLFYAIKSNCPRFLYGRTSGTALGPSSRLSAQPIVEEATTPSDITAPSPSTSETSTVFTDVDGEEEPRSAQPEEDNEQPPPIEVSTIDANAIRSPAVSLKASMLFSMTSINLTPT